ncbi:unnamed protein product [Prorocentrum cordatum]|uniref:Uncharacterized protein n=1 Tax=Prorocentrum cordatum TaxID=2364126 RepID=A0ABN9VKX7_9DINO|nr:unnamed protein product [Polarella glacialis]
MPSHPCRHHSDDADDDDAEHHVRGDSGGGGRGGHDRGDGGGSLATAAMAGTADGARRRPAQAETMYSFRMGNLPRATLASLPLRPVLGRLRWPRSAPRASKWPSAARASFSCVLARKG